MKFTESEWLIMSSLWQENPATARELLQRMPPEVNWAYTTIKTMLTRLVKKKALSEEKVGNTSVYSPEVSRENARKSAVNSLLEKAFGGAVDPFLNFVMAEKKIDPARREEILKLLSQAEEECDD
jgi:BlaI family penicillinase repressor